MLVSVTTCRRGGIAVSSPISHPTHLFVAILPSLIADPHPGESCRFFNATCLDVYFSLLILHLDA